MTKYSSELKLQAILTYLKGTTFFKTIADQFNISLTSLKEWVALSRFNLYVTQVTSFLPTVDGFHLAYG